MAPVSRRKDAGCWPRMSSTFWAVVLLTALLLLYCGKCGSERGWTQLLETCARRVTLRCGSGDGTAQQPRLTHRSRSVGVSFFFWKRAYGRAPPHDFSFTRCVNVSHCLCGLIRGLVESAVVHLRFYARTVTLSSRGRGWGCGCGSLSGRVTRWDSHASVTIRTEGRVQSGGNKRSRSLSRLDEPRA